MRWFFYIYQVHNFTCSFSFQWGILVTTPLFSLSFIRTGRATVFIHLWCSFEMKKLGCRCQVRSSKFAIHHNTSSFLIMSSRVGVKHWLLSATSFICTIQESKSAKSVASSAWILSIMAIWVSTTFVFRETDYWWRIVKFWRYVSRTAASNLWCFFFIVRR